MREGGRFSWHPEPELIGIRDPAASRAALETLGAAAIEVALDYLYGEALRRPVSPLSYPELREHFYRDDLTRENEGKVLDGRSAGPDAAGPSPAPSRPATSSVVLDEFRRRLSPYQFSAYHPRTFSYFTPPPLALSVVGEFLGQVINQGVDVWICGPSGAFVEEEVIGWLCDLVGYRAGGFGILTSGGVMANLLALTVARDIHLARLLGTNPPRGADLDGARVYASDQAHFSVARSLDLLGFPPETLRIVPSDARFRLQGSPVAAAVAEDRAAGLRPFAIAAVAGSTNTGSVDAVGELADVAEREGLWLHVDAAYGGAARLSARDGARVPDLERADSVTVDPHKWFFQAYDIGGLVVKSRTDLLETFHREPEYYRQGRAEVEPLHFYQYGFEGTRRFRALKLWLSWKHLGTIGLGHLVELTNDLAAHLAWCCARDEEFEAWPAEPELSVVCFRHLPGGSAAATRLTLEQLNEHQRQVQRALEISGEGWVSTTILRGQVFLRAGIVNYLSTEEDVEALLATIRRLGEELGGKAGIR